MEDLTTYPSILGGRVKTLHPKVFGGILCRRGLEQDMQQIEKYEIPEIDLVIVDLYPFEATVASGAEEQAIIEKIDIGGISLIRAAAKNFNDVVIIASQAQYKPFRDMLLEHGATTSREERRWFAKEAFAVSSHYDSAIFNYLMVVKVRLSVARWKNKNNFVMVKILIRKVISMEIWMRCSTRFMEKKFTYYNLLEYQCWSC